MLLLKILTLLKDERVASNIVSSLVEKSRTEHEFDEAAKKYIKATSEDFRLRWSNYGFAATPTSIWEELLKNYFNSSVESALQQHLKIANADIVNNVEATQKIYKEVSQDLASSTFTYGNNTHKSIQASVRTAYSNNKDKYRKEFRVFQNDADINPTVIEESAAPLHKITDGLAALRNIPPAEVKVLLSDLFNTRHLYKFEPTSGPHVFYTMYESFLRTHFAYEMSKFNEDHKGNVQINLIGHVDNKCKKFDRIMEAVYENFIIPGISKENIVEFTNTIWLVVDDVAVTNTVRVFGISEIPLEDGNFGNGKTFASTQTAPEKFDKFIKGFLALSKLYGYLRDAGFSPYHIDPNIFHFHMEDPSNKFLTLAEVVECSTTYTSIRNKYDLKAGVNEFKALNHNVSGNLALTSSYDDTILASRKKIVINNLTDSVVNLTSRDPDKSYATMHMTTSGFKVNVFALAECLMEGKNPLYVFFKEDGPEWEEGYYEDPEEVHDPLNMQEYFSEIIGVDASEFLDYYMDRQQLEKLLAVSTNTQLADLMNDLISEELGADPKLLLALESFVTEFKGFLELFNKKYTKNVRVSEIEYSTFLYKHQLFAELHALIDPSEYKQRNEAMVTKVILTLLRKYYPELTLSQLESFLTNNVKNISFRNFLGSIKIPFRNITSYFYYAKSNLFNLSEYGSPIKLSEDDLAYVLSNAPHIEYPQEFENRYKDVSQDRKGYLINDLGELYQIVNHNNKVGALHSSGLYIFTDCTALEWSKIR